MQGKRKSRNFFSFLLCFCQKLSKLWGFFVTKKPLNFIIMSLWNWLLAAWIYEEIFDDDSKNRSCDDSFNNDSFRDYDFDDDF